MKLFISKKQTLFIDTSDNTKTIVGLNSERLEKPTGPDKSQQVLGLINQILIRQRRTINQITEIEVETGAGLPAGRQGSFTGLKVGVSVANALGWSLEIPVNGKKVFEGEIVEPKYE